MIEFVGNVLV